MVTSAGIISTIAGGTNGDGSAAIEAQLNYPTAVAKDAAGNVYIADLNNNSIRKVTSAGIISTFAGNGVGGFSGDGGQATDAEISNPYSVAADVAGNIYIADYSNQLIRKVTSTGIISTFAGNGTQGFSGDGGQATDAALHGPYGVTTDATGNVYIADLFNQSIRKVTTSGIISTIAGNGTTGFSGDGGSATAAALNQPYDVATDAAGNVYIADFNNNRIRMVTSAGIISTFAGNGTTGYTGDGGNATAAEIGNPFGVASDAVGNVYIADANNNLIRMVTSAGIISTIAGNGIWGFSGDGGNATAAELNYPSAVSVDAVGNIYIVDQTNNRIRVVSAALSLTTNTATICLGSTTTLTASGAASYTWAPTSGLSDTTGASVTASPTVSTTYTVSGISTNTVNGIATTSAGITVTTVSVNTLPSISVANTTTVAVCAGTTETLTASGSVSSYTWSTSENTASITPSPTVTTNYTVTGADANGCTNTATTSIAVNLPTTSTISAVGCSSVTVNATSYFMSGTYTQHLTNAVGCDSVITINATVNSVPMVSATSSTLSLCQGDTAILTAHGANSYTWSTTDTTATIAVTPTITTTYTVSGVVGACIVTAIVTQTVSTTCVAGIEQIAGANVAVVIYPNPALAEFTIEAITNAHIIITNTIGQTLINETMQSNKQNYSLQLFANGVYFVKVVYQNKQQTFKLIKQE